MARSKVRIDFRQAGFAEIRTAPKVMAMLNDKAREVAALAESSGPGEFTVHEAQVTGGRVRGRAAVATGDYDAIMSQARNRTLERAVGGQGLVKYTSKSGRVSYISQKQYDNYTSRRRSDA